jgi:pyruvate/2-oxoglutarate dehydrogenase complex dihydrolipoamide dehydrogenase (E3) component
VLKTSARIVGRNEVEVDGRRMRARRGIVIATGSRPAVPPIAGISDVEFWTNREAVETEEPPRSLIVLGAGPIGLEFGQVFHRFGSDVTFVEMAEHALPGDEPENGEAIAEVLRAEGMTLHTGVSAQSVKRTDGGTAVELSDGRVIEGERLLVATGRRSELGELGLDSVDLDPGGRAIEVDEHMRAGEGLWAIGDVTTRGGFTHLAVYEGRVAAADVMGREHRPADYSAIPRVTFTDPEVASVGLTEAQAKEKGISVKTGVSTTSSSARGWIHGPGAEHGVTKVVADAERNVLVGASTMGPAAGEVLGLFVLAIKEGIPVPALRDLIYPYPTFVRGVEDAFRVLEEGR